MKAYFAAIALLVSVYCHAATETEIQERNGFVASNHLGRASLAYKSAAAQRMLAEASYFSKKLGLPPLQPSDIRYCHPSSPLFSIKGSNMMALINKTNPPSFVVCGELTASNLTFIFNQGYLWTIDRKLHYDENAQPAIDTNGAYQLATKFLSAIDIDVSALEKQHKPNVERRWYIRHGTEGDTNLTAVPLKISTDGGREFHDVDYSKLPETNRVYLPSFEVHWDDVAYVKVYGPTKELMQLQYYDLSLSRRPQLVITNAIELNNIPDPPSKTFR